VELALRPWELPRLPHRRRASGTAQQGLRYRAER